MSLRHAALLAFLALCLCADARAAESTDAIRQRLAEVLAGAKGAAPLPGQRLVTQVEVAPLAFPAGAPPPGFRVPESARNVTLRDGTYFRDGRPAFLFGVEGRMYDGAWINRILGLDFFSQHAGTVWWRSAMEVRESPGPRGGLKLTVSLRDSPWPGILAREALRGGTLFACDYYLVKRSDSNLDYRRYRFDPPFFTGLDGDERGTGHFLDLHLENPEAMAYYASAYAYVGRLLKGYPLLHHELVNEVRYTSYWPENLRRFQEAMRAKYATIAAANRAWGTDFAGFDAVIPPVSRDPGDFYWHGPGERFAGHLYADWNAFMAAHAGDVFQELRRAAARTVDPALFTIQSPYAYGDLELTPGIKARAEDVYGQEAFFYAYPQGAPGRERWAVTLALMDQQLSNDLARHACPDKPIVNLEAPCWTTPRYAGSLYGVKDSGPPMGPAAMRRFFWHQAVHGVSGSVLSYFYTNENSEGGPSVWDPRLMERAAVREIPRVRAEIDDLATVVLPRPRIRGRLGVVYSYETAREGPGRRDFRKETMSAYAAAVLTRVPVDIVTAEDIAAGKAAAYPVLLLNHCVRFPREAMAPLADYVRAGGTLVATFDSLQYDDAVLPLETEALLGIRRGPALTTLPEVTEPRADLSEWGLGEVEAAYSRLVGSRGSRLELAGARGIGASPQGPPLAVHSLGKGKVYTVGWSLDGPTLRRVLARVCADGGILPDVDVRCDDGPAEFVETHLLGRAARPGPPNSGGVGGAGRCVVYALNFGGGPRAARLIPRELAKDAGARYLVRDARARAYLGPDGRPGRVAWSAGDFARGIPAALPSGDPILFLVERSALPPLPLKGISREQEEALRWAWRDSPPARRRLLVDGYHVDEFRVSKPKMPTAVKALEDVGWEVNSLLSPLGEEVETFSGKGVTREKLSDYRVILLAGIRHGSNGWKGEEIETLARFARAGGGLLFCLKRNWHFDTLAYDVLKPFSVQEVGGNAHDPADSILGEPTCVGFREPARHPATAGVRLFQSSGARPLQVENRDAVPLFRTAAGASAMDLWGNLRPGGGLPVAVALPFGEGRVAVVGADTWLRPDELELGDNRRFLANLVGWLGE